jgi:acetoin utilization deacetylase AcuC-like enzyme
LITVTGLVYDRIYLEHETGDHVENKQRLVSVLRLLQDKGFLSKLRMIEPRAATLEELGRVHDLPYIKSVENSALQGGGWLDPDTFLSTGSYRAAVMAAGGVLRALETVLDGGATNVFALVRPPGHHALRDRAMGFCLFNNIAVGASHLVNKLGLARVAIIDFDVHHGNGTQAAFDADNRIMYCSVHQSPLYPGTGHLNDTGSGQGKGTKVNVPLPPGCGDADYRAAFEQVIIPAVKRFKPQFLMVSAGFDAHREDGLASMCLSVAGYIWISAAIYRLADECCGGKLVFSLEGGYNLSALSYSVMAVLKVLRGEPGVDDPFPPDREKVIQPPALEIVRRAAVIHGLA